MKNIIKSLLAITAVASIGSASAETIYIAGATAFRSAANPAIAAYCTQNGGSVIASNNTTFGSASKFVGTFSNNGSLHYISVSWSGSEGGIQSAASPRSGARTVNNSFWGTNASGTNSGTTVSRPADLAYSDTYQGTSLFNGVFAGTEYAPLESFEGGSDGIVGVVPFCWVVSTNCPITNITSMQAQALLFDGNVKVSLITGNLSDTNKGVYLLGRNTDSGTRLATFGECGFGTDGLPKQYKYNSTTSVSLWPRETINSQIAALGNGGYSSGSSIVAAMTNALAAGSALKVDGVSSTYAQNYLIGYSGISDANSISGLSKLTYNGVEGSYDNIRNGSYTFWTYEHLYQHPDASPLAKEVAGAIGTATLASTAQDVAPNVIYSLMNVGRNGDGLYIYADYK
jgi:hypothetical protein